MPKKSGWEWKETENDRFIRNKKFNPPVTKPKKGKKNKKQKKSLAKKPMDEFYRSWEWKKARYEALKKYGAVCMLCNSEKNIVVDHIKPRSKFPTLALDVDNLQILCNSCNMGKSNDDYTDFRARVIGIEEAEKELDLQHLNNVVRLFS